jgi:gliding motility-associated-like protein
MRFLSILLLISITYTLSAQPIKLTEGLQAHFTLDGYPIVDKLSNVNKAVVGGDTTLACGVQGSAMRFDGATTEVLFIGPAIFDNFKTGPFSMSFYFKPNTQTGNTTLDIFSKRKTCVSDSSFAIRYTANTNTLSVELTENSKNRNIIVQRLDYGRCWQHIVVTRDFNILKLYVNGRLAQTNLSTRLVPINNDAPLALAKSPCLGSTDRKFVGMIDEIMIYDRKLEEIEVAALYNKPDRIATRDTIIFLGNKIKTTITKTCSTDFTWSPKEDVENAKSAETTITPTKGGQFKYVLSMKEQLCTSVDTLNVKVVDPKDLDCDRLYLPKGFTPNEDGLNDQFYISNPYAVDEVLSFEVLDNWGGRVFYTKDRFERWDGSFNGQKMNPGVYLWKARYRCKGIEKSDFGSVTLLK